MCAVKIKSMIERFDDKDIHKINRATFTREDWIASIIYS